MLWFIKICSWFHMLLIIILAIGVCSAENTKQGVCTRVVKYGIRYVVPLIIFSDFRRSGRRIYSCEW